MSPKRIAAVVLIFIAASIAWVILGRTIVERTQAGYNNIGPEMENLWGTPLVQTAPTVRTERDVIRTRTEKVGRQTKTVSEVVTERQPIELRSSNIDVAMDLEYRRRGLLWFPSYVVTFDGTYTAMNEGNTPCRLLVDFTCQSMEASYDNFVFSVNGQDRWERVEEAFRLRVPLRPGERATIRLAYRTRGMSTWSYAFGQGVQRVRDFTLRAHTDFDRYDFPLGTISPTKKTRTAQGWELTWEARNLLSGFPIGIAVPKKLNPGDVASRIAYFAPVGLLFFFTVMVVWCLMRGINLHPMHFTFLAAGFFAFHLLFAYLVDHVNVMGSFLIAAGVSLALVVNYMRLLTGLRFALLPTGLAQLVFLILFSYAFFFNGFTGLAITIGAVLTLAVLMQVTAKVDWEQAGKPRRELATADEPAQPTA